MTLTEKNLNYGPPPPVTELTMEQDLKLRQLEIRLNSGEVDMKDIVTVFLAMQKQNFVMGNSIKNLIANWPHEKIVFIGTGQGIPIEIQN